MPSETPCLAFTHIPSTDPTALLRHGWGLEAPPKEGLGQREHASGSVLPTPRVLEPLRATSSHKHGVVATNCKGPQRAKWSRPALSSGKPSPATPKPFLFRPTHLCNREPLKPSEKLEC